ncbi:MAG: sugar phosphate isomerase/epimerase [Clostridia bacterium]|jgi:sugar phosphate isomerase/epimerase|nr:sugar phosphate isomerase/epimerase [Clostridia bacterium]
MKIGLCVFSQNIERAAESGYDYIQLPGFEIAEMTDDEFKNVAKKVEKCGITVLGFNAYCTGRLPIASDGFNEENTRKYADLLLKRGCMLGVKNFGIGAPSARKLPKGADVKKAWENGKRFLISTAEEAEKFGINVLVESLNKKCCDFITTLSESKKMVDEVNMKNVHMIVDFYHMKVNGEDYKTAVKYLPYTYDVHISGCGPKNERPFINESNMDELIKISDILKDSGYDKTLSLEPDNWNMKKASYSLKIIRETF